MKTTIDRGGRVVIPKVLRERAGLTPGMEVDVQFNDGNIEIHPPAPQGSLVRKHGLLVWDPGPNAPKVSGEEIQRAIEDVRREREEYIVNGALGREDRS